MSCHFLCLLRSNFCVLPSESDSAVLSFGEGLEFLLLSVDCVGNENFLLECTCTSTTSCGNAKSAGVRCFNSKRKYYSFTATAKIQCYIHRVRMQHWRSKISKWF